MAHNVLDVANRIIRMADEDGVALTPLKIQKLAYYCEALMQGMYGKTLIKQPIEAWEYGPVFRDLYVALHDYGRDPVSEPIADVKSERYESDEETVIRGVWNNYGQASASRLVTLTHTIGTPWYVVKHDKQKYPEAKPAIPKSLIKRYYQDLVERYNRESATNAKP